MNGTKKTQGEFVTSVTVDEIIVSIGIQLVQWANDIAFTDKPFGETWAMETADRMASCSELLNVAYKRLPQVVKGIIVDLPDGMIGQIAINEHFVLEAEEPASKNTGSTDIEGGVQSSIDDFPF